MLRELLGIPQHYPVPQPEPEPTLKIGNIVVEVAAEQVGLQKQNLGGKKLFVHNVSLLTNEMVRSSTHLKGSTLWTGQTPSEVPMQNVSK